MLAEERASSGAIVFDNLREKSAGRRNGIFLGIKFEPVESPV
jgi:hypothetical protein